MSQTNTVDEPSPQETVKLTVADTGNTPKRRKGRRLLTILAILLFLCVMLGMVATSGYAGVQAGREDLKVRGTATANAYLLERFQRGLDLLNQGNWALAEANFEDVLRYQPSNIGVQQLLATARVAQTPTPTPIPPTPTPIVVDKGALFQLMKDAYDRKDWDTVISLGDQLRALDSEYERATVTEMRFQALVTRGLDRLNEGDIEAGLYDLDVAATIRNLDELTESQRQLAALYQNALYYFGADWDKTIKLLSQVYAISPAYRDVAKKLNEAYVLSGDAYASLQDWCPSEQRYAGAIRIIASTAIEQKRSDAQQRCLTATAIPVNGTPGVARVLPDGAGINGRLVYPAYDTATNGYQLAIYDSSSRQVSSLEPGGSQPIYQRMAGAVAYTVGSIIRGLYSNGSIATLHNGPGSWPSLSPDGSRIAYALYQENSWRIYVAPVDGSRAPTLLTEGSYPAWGPGGRIAYQGCISGQCGIYLVNPDQPSDLQRVSTSANDINIQWSPDGSQLVYMTNYTGNWEIFTVSLARQFRQLTSLRALTGAPVWSPDGSQIAFESNYNGDWGIWVVNSDGSALQKVIDLGSQNPAWQSERLAWTP